MEVTWTLLTEYCWTGWTGGGSGLGTFIGIKGTTGLGVEEMYIGKDELEMELWTSEVEVEVWMLGGIGVAKIGFLSVGFKGTKVSKVGCSSAATATTSLGTFFTKTKLGKVTWGPVKISENDFGVTSCKVVSAGKKRKQFLRQFGKENSVLPTVTFYIWNGT